MFNIGFSIVMFTSSPPLNKNITANILIDDGDDDKPKVFETMEVYQGENLYFPIFENELSPTKGKSLPIRHKQTCPDLSRTKVII